MFGFSGKCLPLKWAYREVPSPASSWWTFFADFFGARFSGAFPLLTAENTHRKFRETFGGKIWWKHSVFGAYFQCACWYVFRCVFGEQLPWPSKPCLFCFPCFSHFVRFSLRFCFFSNDFGGSTDRKILAFFGGSLLFEQKKARMGGSGLLSRNRKNSHRIRSARETPYQIVNTLSFLSLIFWFYQPQNYQGFSVPAEPTKSLEETEKHQDNQGSSLFKIYQGRTGQGNNFCRETFRCLVGRPLKST